MAVCPIVWSGSNNGFKAETGASAAAELVFQLICNIDFGNTWLNHIKQSVKGSLRNTAGFANRCDFFRCFDPAKIFYIRSALYKTCSCTLFGQCLIICKGDILSINSAFFDSALFYQFSGTSKVARTACKRAYFQTFCFLFRLISKASICDKIIFVCCQKQYSNSIFTSKSGQIFNIRTSADNQCFYFILLHGRF